MPKNTAGAPAAQPEVVPANVACSATHDPTDADLPSNIPPRVLRRPVEFTQYAAHAYRRLLEKNGMRCSMSRRGNCWDNAPMESFFGSMKSELGENVGFETRREAKAAIFGFVETFYNRRRLHSAIGYRSPIEWELIAAAA
jgi:putative transposase